MEISAFKEPRMPSEYYRRQAARVRALAQNATTDAIREHLAEVALQYEKLAEGVEAVTSSLIY
jgi:DNA-binding TFAR19-related protein (PDSD5 family)